MIRPKLKKGAQPGNRNAAGNSNHLKHGMAEHPAYARWRTMRDRCQLPTQARWKDYGGRGISICQEWSTFEGFWRDMGPTYRPNLTLERRDNNVGYSKANCYWATRKQQARNKRNSRLIDTPWGMMTLAEAAERSGVKRVTIWWRLNRGLPAFTTVSHQTGEPLVDLDMVSRS
jgi:hypothetical protein